MSRAHGDSRQGPRPTTGCYPASLRPGHLPARRGIRRAGRVFEVWRQGDLINGRCQGSEPAPYHTAVRITGGDPGQARCDCPLRVRRLLQTCDRAASHLMRSRPAPTRTGTRPSRVGWSTCASSTLPWAASKNGTRACAPSANSTVGGERSSRQSNTSRKPDSKVALRGPGAPNAEAPASSQRHLTDAGAAAERRIIPRARRAARRARNCCRSHPAASAENPPAG